MSDTIQHLPPLNAVVVTTITEKGYYAFLTF